MSAYTPINNTPIESKDQLHEFMLSGCKEPHDWRIGTEHEKFGFSMARKARPKFKGEIEALFHAFENEGWLATREINPDGQPGAIIALHHQQASITLEPGGQLELSGAPLRTLSEMSKELDDHLRLLKKLSEPLNLIWSGLGTDPTPALDTPKMPKARYQVMRNYLPKKGDLALHMMHSTCTIQTNLDYSSESDAMRKLRLGLYLQPLVMAMFANSFVLDGQLRDGVCARSQIWLNTDPDRYFYPAEWLKEDTPLIRYIDWAISTPMFFFARDGQYIDCAGLPFKQFMKEGFQGYQANMGDFELHLSTLFPDTRLKTHFEVRGADMSSPEYVKALSAFHVGLMYDSQSLDRALTHFESISPNELWETRKSLDHFGLNTLLAGRPLKSHAEFMIELALEGLERWEPEALGYLTHLHENVKDGLSPAHYNRKLWPNGYQGLMEGTRIA